MKIEGNFKDFDYFYEHATNWELDFRLLSKNDFNAYLNIFSNQTFQIGRTKLTGKIEQFGLTPGGFRSMVIPVNYKSQYVWLNKKVSGSQLLIFPKKGSLEAVSYNDFDVYVVSVQETLLLKMLDNLGYNNAKKIFKGDEQHISMNRLFATTFHQLASNFLQNNSSNLVLQKNLIDNIIFFLVKFIEDNNPLGKKKMQRRRDGALKKAIGLINESEDIVNIEELCSLTKVCERTLLYAFKEKYRVTPSQYIMGNRLHRVKMDLISSRGDNAKISTLAGKYGFWHMGQFAADFKKQFGKLPSEYLKGSNFNEI